jgi:uncharacterized protein involved in exopolysaccharide biosynthesis/Mrp family chromosome partitioning ATPase
MLERVRTEIEPGADISRAPSHEALSAEDILAFLRSYWPFIAMSALVGLMFGIAYVVVVKRTYVATAQILIDTNQHPTPTLANTETLIAMDTPQIESEIALLGSEQIVGKVAQMLDDRREADALAKGSGSSATGKSPPATSDQRDKSSAAATEKSDTSRMSGSYFSWFHQLLFGSPEQSGQSEKQARLHAEMLKIQYDMDVQRIGLSYVLNLSYRAEDPKTAALVANAISDAYVQDKLDLRTQSARQGGAWLEARIGELRQLMNDAALDVKLFKAKRDYRLLDRPNSEQPLGAIGESLPNFEPNVVGGDRAAAPPRREAGVRSANEKAQAEPRQTTLDELESRAETYKKIYESYLQAYMETVQRQSYPGTNARVITRADPPLRKSTPRTTLSLAASIVFGTIMGLGLSFAHASLGQTVRSARQILQKLDSPLLGQVIHSHFLHGVPFAHSFPHPFRRDKCGQHYASFFVVENKSVPKVARELNAVAVALKRAVDAHEAHVVGLLGTNSSPNSAAMASNLALLNAHAGWRTLLVETATTSPNLKSVFSPDSRYGLQDLLAGRANDADVLVVATQNPNLSLLLAEGRGTIWRQEQISALRSLIDRVSDQFDVILVHLPSSHAMNRAVAAVDNVVIIAQAGKTTMSELEDITSDLRLAGKRPLGVIGSDFV